jgi:hypothetical protein
MEMIVVCGDSFIAPDPVAPGKHFSEIMGATSLAKPGCGNIDICFQIKEAIKIKPEHVVIGTTDNARTEIKMTDEVLHDLSLQNFRNGDYISDTIPTLIGEEIDLRDKYFIPAVRRDSIKRYFVDVYDSTIKHTTDMWALGYWYRQLQDHGIKYTVLDKNFCIYEYATKHPHEPYSFHTDFVTQEKAAILLLQK